MGYSRSDTGASRAFTASYASATASRTVRDYRATELKRDFDPRLIKVRESRKSEANPNPVPIIVGLDVSGSMGRVVEAMRKGLGTLFEQVIDRKVVTDPHVLAMAIGDMECDSAPVQATQFESEPVTIGKQIEDLYLEQGGGGNNHESYLGPLYFATERTDCDAFKEGRKGFLFTVGDEEPQMELTARMLQRFFGAQSSGDITAEQMITRVSQNWHYFHIIVDEGDYARGAPKKVHAAWTKLLRQNVIHLKDHKKMAEVIVAAIEVTVGRDKDAVAESWKGDSGVVADAIKDLPSFPALDLPSATTPPA